MDRRKLLKRITSGAVNDVRFADFVDLVEAFGFELQSRKGSHLTYGRADVRQILTVQERKGEAKPYEVRQLIHLVERYNLVLEDS